MMRVFALAVVLVTGMLVAGVPAVQAQDHSQHQIAQPQDSAAQVPENACPPEHAAMGHCTPDASPAPASPAPADDPDCPPEHAAMGHCTPKAAPPAAMPGTDNAPDSAPDSASDTASGTTLPAGNAPAPTPPEANYADRIWGREAMAPVRDAIRKEHGGASFSQIMIDIAELQIRQGREGYRWEGEGWFGGDINRLVIRTEGEGNFGETIEDAEVQALYSRAIGPYFNLQGGVRHDFEPKARSYAALGIEGLAPYWFEIEAHAFVSTRGDVLGRLSANYDQRISQRLILQPRIEFNLAAQDVRESGIGSGLSDAELDLRLRYEIAREFAPYIGISHSAKIGRTADFARLAGEDPSTTSVVIGVRAWF